VFDQKKFKKKDQGFLGVVNVQISSVFDLNVGGDGKLSIQIIREITYLFYLLLLQKCWH
jgi:E3 ubiquitin-protein ligase NEDD4